MGDLSGCRVLVWALLALLWVQKAGKWTLSHPHGLATPTGHSPGFLPLRMDGQEMPGPPGATAKRVWPPGLEGVGAGERAESGGLSGSRVAPGTATSTGPCPEGSTFILPSQPARVTAILAAPTAALKYLLETGLQRGGQGPSCREPRPNPWPYTRLYTSC